MCTYCVPKTILDAVNSAPNWRNYHLIRLFGSAQRPSPSLGDREYIEGCGTNIFANFTDGWDNQENLPGTEPH